MSETGFEFSPIFEVEPLSVWRLSTGKLMVGVAISACYCVPMFFGLITLFTYLLFPVLVFRSIILESSRNSSRHHRNGWAMTTCWLTRGIFFVVAMNMISIILGFCYFGRMFLIRNLDSKNWTGIDLVFNAWLYVPVLLMGMLLFLMLTPPRPARRAA